MKSILADMEARVWNRNRLQKMTDLFIAPSAFMHNKMLEGGFSRKKLTVVCNFIDPVREFDYAERCGVERKIKDYFCYVGKPDEKLQEYMLGAAEAGVRSESGRRRGLFWRR